MTRRFDIYDGMVWLGSRQCTREEVETRWPWLLKYLMP